jgi:hypothetical protein
MPFKTFAATMVALGLGLAPALSPSVARADSCGLDCGPKAMQGQHYSVRNGSVVPDENTAKSGFGTAQPMPAEEQGSTTTRAAPRTTLGTGNPSSQTEGTGANR